MNIVGVGASTKVIGVFYFNTKDLSFVTDTGSPADPQDGMGAITHLRFDCTEPDQLIAMSGGKSLGIVYCPPFTELAKKGAGCTTINRTADLAFSGKPGVQSNVAETVRVDLA